MHGERKRDQEKVEFMVLNGIWTTVMTKEQQDCNDYDLCIWFTRDWIALTTIQGITATKRSFASSVRDGYG